MHRNIETLITAIRWSQSCRAPCQFAGQNPGLTINEPATGVDHGVRTRDASTANRPWQLGLHCNSRHSTQTCFLPNAVRRLRVRWRNVGESQIEVKIKRISNTKTLRDTVPMTGRLSGRDEAGFTQSVSLKNRHWATFREVIYFILSPWHAWLGPPAGRAG